MSIARQEYMPDRIIVWGDPEDVDMEARLWLVGPTDETPNADPEYSSYYLRSDLVDAKDARIATLTEALTFYADARNWHPGAASVGGNLSPANTDSGAHARAALREG